MIATNHKVEMGGGQNIVNGTSLMGYIDVSYQKLVRIFGLPNGVTDEYKVDAEWYGTINDKVFTIYNYKDGKNYCGRHGKAVEDIRDWHVGGNSPEVVKLITEYCDSF